MFLTFNLSFNILASVLATFPNIGRIFAQFSGHSVLLPYELGNSNTRAEQNISFMNETKQNEIQPRL